MLLDAEEDAALERVAGRETDGDLAAFVAGGCVVPVVFEAATTVLDFVAADELVVAAGLVAFFSAAFAARVSFFGDSGGTTSGCFSSFTGSVA